MQGTRLLSTQMVWFRYRNNHANRVRFYFPLSLLTIRWLQVWYAPHIQGAKGLL